MRIMSLGSDWSSKEWPGIEKHPQLQQNESIDEGCESETMTAPVSDDDDDGDDDDTWSKSSVDDSISLPISDDAPLPPPASDHASEEPPDYSAVAERQSDDVPPILPSAPQAVNWLAQLAHTSVLPENNTEPAPDQATKQRLFRRLRK